MVSRILVASKKFTGQKVFLSTVFRSQLPLVEKAFPFKKKMVCGPQFGYDFLRNTCNIRPILSIFSSEN